MEHITIIFSDAGDTDCQRLPILWRDIPEEIITLITISSGEVNWEETVDNAISAESDTLLLCGHGTGCGLLYPDLDRGEYVIHEENYRLIHARNVICLWCHASTFGVTYKVPALYTSMFISNVNEAHNNLCYSSTEEDISRSNSFFYRRVNRLIRDDIPLSEWVRRLWAQADAKNEIDQFNYSGLMLID